MVAYSRVQTMVGTTIHVIDARDTFHMANNNPNAELLDGSYPRYLNTQNFLP